MMQNFFIVITHKTDGWDKIIGRRKTTLEEINAQAEWIWSLLKNRERRHYRISVQGEPTDGIKFDSDMLHGRLYTI